MVPVRGHHVAVHGNTGADSKPARHLSLTASSLKVLAVSGKLQLDAKALLLLGEQHVRGLTLAPEGAPDASSQLEEVLFAVITYFGRDAFDRLRERPTLGVSPERQYDRIDER